MDKNFGPPVKIDIAENPDVRIKAVRNIYFSGIHVNSPSGIQLVGRAENMLSDIKFSDCTFETIDYSEFGNKFYHGGQSKAKIHGAYPKMEYCEKITFNNVEFKTK